MTNQDDAAFAAGYASLPPPPTSIPTQTVLGGMYTYNWGPEGVTITVEEVRPNRDRMLQGELKIVGSPEGHIHGCRLGFLNTRMFGEIARHCERRDTKGRDWIAIIEQVAQMTMEHYRTGEPLLNLGEVKPPPEPAFRLRPFIVDGEATIIYGEGGIGKSYIAGYMAALVDQGLSTELCDPIPGTVLYLDYETTGDIAARRMQAITRGFGVGGYSKVLYRFCHQSLPSEISAVQRIVAERNVSLIVVDSAGPACGGDTESAASAINYFTALRSLRVASITIAHRSKGGSVGPFGSVYWVNYPRMSFELRKSQEEESDIMHVALLHRKVNDGRLMHPLSFKIEWHHTGVVTVTQEDIESVPEFHSELSIADQLSLILRDQGPKTAKELQEATGLAAKSISTTLSRNARFENVGGQRWYVID